MIDATDQYEDAIEIIIDFNNIVATYKGSDQTGKDIKDFWNDLDKLADRINSLIDGHNELMAEVGEEIRDAWEASEETFH